MSLRTTAVYNSLHPALLPHKTTGRPLHLVMMTSDILGQIIDLVGLVSKTHGTILTVGILF